MELPDPSVISAQLLSPTTSRDSLIRSSPATVVRNLVAWESYVNAYNNQLDDLRNNVVSRLKGYMLRINVLLDEIVYERNLSKETNAALGRFEKWWKVMKREVSEYENKVHAMEEMSVATAEPLETGTRGSSIWSLPH